MSLRVNGVEITDAAIEFEMKRLADFYSKHAPRSMIEEEEAALRAKAREQAIGTQLLMQEAQRLEIAVPDSEVDSTLQRMIDTAGGEGAFARLLVRQNLSRDGIRRSIAEGKRIDRLVQEITKTVPAPTEEEILLYYEANKGDYARPERVMAQHILIKPDSNSQEDRDAAVAELEFIRSEFETGVDFGDLAAANSDCPSGTKTGGSLGWVARGTMIPDFEEALFSSEDGQLSPVVETPLGFHLILRTAHEESAAASCEDSRELIRDLLFHNAKGEAVTEYVTKLKSAAKLDEE